MKLNNYYNYIHKDPFTGELCSARMLYTHNTKKYAVMSCGYCRAKKYIKKNRTNNNI